MTVSELIKKLETLPKGKEVIIYSENIMEHEEIESVYHVDYEDYVTIYVQ